MRKNVIIEKGEMLVKIQDKGNHYDVLKMSDSFWLHSYGDKHDMTFRISKEDAEDLLEEGGE